VIRLDTDGYIDRTTNWQLRDEEKGDPVGSQSEFFAVIKLRAAKMISPPKKYKTQIIASRR
jgi:hypothetical protein